MIRSSGSASMKLGRMGDIPEFSASIKIRLFTLFYITRRRDHWNAVLLHLHFSGGRCSSASFEFIGRPLTEPENRFPGSQPGRAAAPPGARPEVHDRHPTFAAEHMSGFHGS